ncbi:hypothetical protein C8J57DRAFT_1617756, partial [Mycena rebaudengoi]
VAGWVRSLCTYFSPFSGTSPLLRLIVYPTLLRTPPPPLLFVLRLVLPVAKLPDCVCYSHLPLPARSPPFHTSPSTSPLLLLHVPPPPHLLLQNDLTGAAGSCSSFGSAGRNERVLLLLPLDNGRRLRRGQVEGRGWRVGRSSNDWGTTSVGAPPARLRLLPLRPRHGRVWLLRLCSGRLLSSSNPFLPSPSYPSSVPTLFYPPSCSQSSPRLSFYLTLVPLRACAPTHASALHAPSCATALEVGVWFGLVTSARVVNRPRASPRRMRRGEVVCYGTSPRENTRGGRVVGASGKPIGH